MKQRARDAVGALQVELQLSIAIGRLVETNLFLVAAAPAVVRAIAYLELVLAASGRLVVNIAASVPPELVLFADGERTSDARIALETYAIVID